MLDDRREGSQRGLLGSLYAGIVIGLGSILRWTILHIAQTTKRLHDVTDPGTQGILVVSFLYGLVKYYRQ